MSQEVQEIRASELDFDDPRLPKLQAKEHAEHAQMAISHRRKQMAREAFAKSKLGSSEDRARLIDLNTVHLAQKVRAINAINVRKRKAQVVEPTGRKRRKITFGKYKLRKVQRTEKASFLWCFDRRGGPRGRVHTHVWQALV